MNAAILIARVIQPVRAVSGGNMSRTRHHRSQKYQNCGHDLWSRRPNSGASYSKASRFITKRKERQRDRELEHQAMQGDDVRGRNPGE